MIGGSGEEKIGFAHQDLTRWYDFHARQYDAAVGRWFGVDPQDQFASPYVGMGNNPVMMVDPDGEFAFLAAALFAKKAIVALKAAKVAKVAVAATKTANASKLASVITKATSTKGLKTGLKSGAINMISNYNAKKGFGWNTLGDFAAGFAGGSFGFGAENKLIGMGVGGLATWGVNGASFDYQGAQEFVGGALSSYVGMGKAVKGKHAVFKQIEGGNTLVKLNDGKFLSKTLMKHGDNFVNYGIQNNAYDFAYSKEEDFMSRGWGHLELFAWGGLSSSFQNVSWERERWIGQTLFYTGIDWGINGAIKKRFTGIKVDGSQTNKLILGYLKWLQLLYE
ncbi:hypothetical protein MMU07_04610 [Aquiflexum sp. LQ15W]|uniref:RHS repeat domain-containing protein n=1 Tax=Cognataquiflexum nitidum TaxID=2922272 RepID=UPI001F1339B1|nr:RHS repeat-associated core domain-containing protein [Cognataquiflexum nitidum]MCH6198846.1 hypothetical protein [Cognataquiflexum nitidum]